MKYITILASILCLVTLPVISNAQVPPEEHYQLGSRIYNVQEAARGQFPYQALMYVQFPADKEIMCSGALIGDEWIITAAHCVNGALSCEISLGVVNRFLPQVIRFINSSNIFVHPGFQTNTLENDIALIEIDAVQISSNIKPIKIPDLYDFTQYRKNELAIISGWGYTDKLGVGTYLQWATVNFADPYECKKYHPNFKLFMICISTERNSAACHGDSGGPLVIEQVLVGVASFWGSDKCSSEYPAVYTSISTYLGWIEEMTGISYENYASDETSELIFKNVLDILLEIEEVILS